MNGARRGLLAQVRSWYVEGWLDSLEGRLDVSEDGAR